MALMKILEEVLGGYRQDSWEYPGIAILEILLHNEIMNICNNNIQMDVVLNTVVLVICDCVRADTSNL